MRAQRHRTTPDPAVCFANLAKRAPDIRRVWPTWHAMVAAIGQPLPGQRLGRKRLYEPHGPGNTVWVSAYLRDVAEAARKARLPYHLVYARLRRGASLREATKRPPRTYRRQRLSAADILRGADAP